ncbi:MAG: methyltransferase domain-containing protein, partial [Pseudomonadota bacterium]
SQFCVERASPEIQAKIRVEFFDKKNISPESFDLVTCFSTLEHLPDPLMAMKLVHQSLRTGRAVALVIHNERSLAHRLLGRKSILYDLQHYQIFNHESMSLLLRQAGFEQFKYYPFVNNYRLGYWFDLLPLPKVIKRMIISVMPKKVWQWRLSLDVGNQFWLAFK